MLVESTVDDDQTDDTDDDDDDGDDGCVESSSYIDTMIRLVDSDVVDRVGMHW